MTPFTDVPIAVMFLHLAALTVLFVHSAVTQLRRFVLIRQNRRSAPLTRWTRLLQVSLGLTK